MLSLLAFLGCAVVGQSLKSTREPVVSIPGFGTPPTNHWTGFVPVDEESGDTLFYYLIESASDPASDPLLWWMNGGPGASSLAGLVSENGPLLVNDEGMLMENPLSWNQKANLLYVEFAPGIGYSYCKNSSRTDLSCNQTDPTCSPCLASDSSVVRDNVAFITALLGGRNGDAALFPELRGRPLYLAGESYAGVYIPTLAKALLSSFGDTFVVNLHGFWVTDPCTDNDAQFGWLDLGLDFAYESDLITQPLYQLLSSTQCTEGRTLVGDRLRNVQDLECRRGWRQYDIATAGIGDAVHPAPIPGLPMYIDPLNAIGPVTGFDIQGWLGSEEVRKALHAEKSPNTAYHLEIGNNGYPQYTLEYAACNNNPVYKNVSMVDVYHDIVALTRGGRGAANFHKIVVSSGDIDPVVNLHGTERAVRKMGYKEKEGQPRRPWFFNSSAFPDQTLLTKPIGWGQTLHSMQAGAQIGGFTIGYDTMSQVSLDFVSVRASGHMVPAYAPRKSLHVIQRLLINDKALTPPLPKGWDTDGDDVFYARNGDGASGTFAKWVNQARSADYLSDN